ncbi:hypothetical protein C3L33_14088, partial [Rhododendron williamsianum]
QGMVSVRKEWVSREACDAYYLSVPRWPAARMSTPSRKRLMRDFKRLQQDPPAGISGAPHDNNIMLWNAVIFGPDDTPWDGVFPVVSFCSVILACLHSPGTFKLTLQFSEDYPNKPPTVRFVSRMFHPNSKFEACSFSFFIYIFSPEVGCTAVVDGTCIFRVYAVWFTLPFPSFPSLLAVYADGSICLDILQNQWSPIYDVAAILTSIQSLLCDPNPNSPANSEAARMYSENKREYNRRVRESVEQSWTAD